MIISNVAVELGLVNGTQGVVVGFLYADNVNFIDDVHILPHYAKLNVDIKCNTVQKSVKENHALPIVLLQIDEGLYKGDSFDCEKDRIVAIKPETRNKNISLQ